MVSPTLDSRTADIYLEWGGVKMGYRLVNSAEGNVSGYRPGLAPDLAPQQRTTPFSYEHEDPRVDIPVAFEDFRGGAGTERAESGFGPGETPIATQRYNYAKGLDLSWPNRLYLSPEQQTTSGVAAAPFAFSETSLGIFVTAGRYLYELSATTWTQRHDLGADKAFTGGVVEFSESNDAAVLVAATGASDIYVYSTDGITWSDSGADDKNYIDFTVRGQNSNTPQLWAVDTAGQIRVTQAPRSGGTTWSASTHLGVAGETVQRLLTADDRIHLFKVEGIWDFDGTTPQDVWTGGRQMQRTDNGTNPFLWNDGRIYVPYGDRLMQFDPQAAAGGNPSFTFVYPRLSAGNPVVNGQITAITGDGDFLYIATKNSDGDTYLQKWDGNPQTGWHPFVYLGANDCGAMIVLGPGTPETSNPCLLFGYGTAVRYVILPRSGMRPEDDSNYRFEASDSGNKAYGPWMTVGAQLFSKFLNAGRIVSESTTGGRAIELSYEIDNNGTETSLVVANAAGTQKTIVTDEVEFNRIRWIIEGRNTDNTLSPRALGWIFNTTLNPPRKRSWQLDLMISNLTNQRGGGGALREAGRSAEEHLFGAAEQRVTFYDRDNRTFIVRILDIGGAGAAPAQSGDVRFHTVSLIEISETTENPDPLTWDEDAWDEKGWGT